MVNLDVRVAPHFRLREFACKCGGRYKNCAIAYVHAGLAASLESLRNRYYATTGLTIVSGYRCRDYNRSKAVNGASDSQHIYGCGADIPARVTFTVVKGMGIFSGIGIQQSSKLVTHVDIRHLGPKNSLGTDGKTKASPTNPAVWFYG